MSLEFAILLLGGLFFASLLAIALFAELRTEHPWRRFVEDRSLSFRRVGRDGHLEGTYGGRPVSARLLAAGEELRTQVAVPLQLDGPVEASPEVVERLDELVGAEPRLRYSDGELLFEAEGLIEARRELGDLLDRMVDSAKYAEGRF